MCKNEHMETIIAYFDVFRKEFPRATIAHSVSVLFVILLVGVLIQSPSSPTHTVIPVRGDARLLTSPLLQEGILENENTLFLNAFPESLYPLYESGVIPIYTSPLTNVTARANGIKKYTVRKGDTLPVLAEKFGITKETISSANNNRTAFKRGEEIIILPVSGILYSVGAQDTLQSLANQYHIESDDIISANQNYQEVLLSHKGTLILPLAVMQKNNEKPIVQKTLLAIPNYFILPAKGRNQNELHNENAVDIVNACGTSVVASHDGIVVPDEQLGDGASGWNNGYGTFILLEHENGTHTRYARLNNRVAHMGELVKQGAVIGKMGNTGSAHSVSDCFLHFEVIGAQNPFATR